MTDTSTPKTDAVDPDVTAELARLGVAFHHQTQMMHLLLSVGREDTADFTDVQRERIALSSRISEVMEGLGEDARNSLRMSRLTDAGEK